MQNYVSICEHQTKPNPALAAVHDRATLLLRYDVPTYYISPELIAAAVRTEPPDDMVFEAIPFPFDALVFMSSSAAKSHKPMAFLAFSASLPRRHDKQPNFLFVGPMCRSNPARQIR